MRSATCLIVRASSVSRSAIACFAGKSIDGARVRILHSLGSFLADSAHGSPSPTARHQTGGYVNSGRAPDAYTLDPLAPDPNTKVPRFKMPLLACDAHCHVFGPAAKFPYAADRAYTPPDAPKEYLAALHKILGVSRAVIVQASCHGTDNRAMLDAIASSNGAYRGIAIVGPDIGDDELASLDRGGVRGVRFNFVAHLGGAPDLELFDRTIDRIGGLGWHVVLHLDAEDILTYEDRIKRLRVPFVIDHMGRVKAAGGLDQAPFKRLLALMRNPLAWVKVCG